MRRLTRVLMIAILAASGFAVLVPPALDAQAEPLRRPRSVARSNVGYVDNAVIGTHFQIRYDYASGADSPDRAEFIYPKCGCFRVLGADPDAPGPVGPGPAAPTTALIEYDLDYQDITVDGEVALHDRVSAFAEIPFRIARGQVIPDSEGLADIMAGVKFAVIADPERYLTLQLRTYLPTGNGEDGLGTEHVSLEPGILFHEGSGGRLTAEAELRLWIPMDGSSNAGTPTSVTAENYYGNVLRYGVGLGYELSPEAQLRFTPVVELVGWNVMGGIVAFSPDGVPANPNTTVEDADGTSIMNLKAGARIGVRASDAIYVGYGKALTDEHWYDSVFRVEYRWVR